MARTDSFENIQKTLDLAGQELKILHQISSTISSTLDLDEVLQKIIGLVIQVTRGDSCFLYLLDETEDFLILRASKNPHPRLIGRISVKLGEGITGWVAQESQQVAIARHASKDSRFKFFNNLPEDKFEAFMSVPIIASGRVVGVINVQHRRAHRHSEDEKTLLSIIGLQVGSAIRNARLYEETSQRSRQITTLAKVGQLIASGEYLDEMLQLIVRMIAEMMQARVCSIMLVDTQKNELVLKAAKCSSEEYWQRPNLKIGRSLVSRVVKEKAPLMVRDVTKEEGYLYPGTRDKGRRQGAGIGADDLSGTRHRRDQRVFGGGAGVFQRRRSGADSRSGSGCAGVRKYQAKRRGSGDPGSAADTKACRAREEHSAEACQPQRRRSLQELTAAEHADAESPCGRLQRP